MKRLQKRKSTIDSVTAFGLPPVCICAYAACSCGNGGSIVKANVTEAYTPAESNMG